MDGIRRTFLDTAAVSLEMIEVPEVAAHWDEPSVLPEFSTRGLCGHLVRATTSVRDYLDASEPDEEPIGPAMYYVKVLGDGGPIDLQADVHVGVRERSEALAEGGPRATAGRLREALDEVEERLLLESPERKVRVFGGHPMMLDDYLVTRLIEQTVHIDDLATTLGLEPPVLPLRATELAIYNLVRIGRLRHGDLGVLRALTRRERDTVGALHVI